MAERRRQFREMEVLATLLMQGAVIPCKRCRVAFVIEDVKGGNIQKEHLHELKLGGEDEPHNCAFSHTDCHKIITHGTGATTADSSLHRIAKTKPPRTDKFVVNKAGPQPSRPEPIDPGIRCRRCGEYGEDCQCPPIPERSSFRRTG